MTFLRKYWYDLAPFFIVIAILDLIITWSSSSFLEKLAIINFGVMWWHQFEEYRFPGGEPAITNLAMQYKEGLKHDRNPLNQNNAMIINLGASLVFYVLPIFWPNTLWLSFAPVVFGGVGQVIVHIILTPKKIGNHIYSPGAGAVIFGHVPVAVCWFWYTISHNLLTWVQVLWGLVYLLVFVVIFMVKFGYGTLITNDDRYAFSIKEFERGGYAERIRKIKKIN